MNQNTPDERARSAAYLDADHAWRRTSPPEMDRLRRTLAVLPLTAGSLLDVGVGEGDWLRLLARTRPGLRLAALDLSPRRLADLRVVHQDGLPVVTHEGSITDPPIAPGSFDAVTLLEVVEHVPDWKAAVRSALRLARRTVLVTVPFREHLMNTVCVHCHQPTPLWGHLHSFDEASFAEFADVATLTTRRIPRRPSRQAGFLRWAVRSVLPVPAWLAVRLDLKGS